MIEPVENLPYWEYRREAGRLESLEKPVVLEHQMDLTINNEHWLSFICSPIDLEALGVGFLYTENIIHSLLDIDSIHLSEDAHALDIHLHQEIEKPKSFHRTSTSISLDTNGKPEPFVADTSLSSEDLLQLYKEFNELQTFHRLAGGFHSASLADSKKNRLFVEDLGRHNCVDKLAGLYLLNHEEFKIEALLLSGRISSEMIAKSQAMQVPVIVSRTSPTTAAIHTAEAAGVTLVGYLRADRFDLYTHPENLVI